MVGDRLRDLEYQRARGSPSCETSGQGFCRTSVRPPRQATLASFKEAKNLNPWKGRSSARQLSLPSHQAFYLMKASDKLGWCSFSARKNWTDMFRMSCEGWVKFLARSSHSFCTFTCFPLITPMKVLNNMSFKGKITESKPDAIDYGPNKTR